MTAQASPVPYKSLPQDTFVTQIKQRAEQSPVFNAMVHWFAVRERTRQQITLAHLKQKMGKEGYTFAPEAYGEELVFMANLGIGKLEHDAKGRIKALKGIRLTLQSIGAAAIENKKVVNSKPATQYAKLPVKPKSQFNTVLSVKIEGKTMDFSFNLSSDKMVSLIAELSKQSG